MHLSIYRFVFLVSMLFFNLFGLKAQTLFPGDINNNGQVTGIDFLYLGLAYGETGPARLQATSNWESQNISNQWANSFPDGRNYAYADANGDGVINDSDLATALWPNFGQIQNGSIGTDGNSIGLLNVHPELKLEANVERTTPGSSIEVELSLGTTAIPVENFYGVAFTIEYTVDQVDSEFGLSFELEDDAWVDPSGAACRSMVINNSENGSTDIAITRIDQSTINNGSGIIGKFSIVVEDDIINFFTFDTLIFEVSKIRLIDNELNTTPVATNQLMVLIDNTDESPISECPTTPDPVCGSDGITYLNACYAIASGVTTYTSGVCYPSCIDPNEMDANANCVQVYDPVCGCNEVTYINECVAEAAGVISYTAGPCPNDKTCYDPLLVLASNGTTLDNSTGIIESDCNFSFQDPVCGCNGVTYVNECTAEANGISFYTKGVCESPCIDTDIMYRDPTCPTTYDPVCGCNGETYINECEASAAGVTSFTPGACGSTSTWCSEAVAIDCGVFLTGESTIGAGNEIESYPGCLTTASLIGPDRVYVFNKTTTGDIQIGLEIITPGLDLDVFLLRGECSQVTCLGASYTDNSTSNNEGIVYENAPIGTYYIVVDGQYVTSEGLFNLELSCGTLVCDDAIELACGQPIQHTTVNGRDDVSLYTCANGQVNVENNGPEVVHTFTLAQGGIVDIKMTELNTNLELFLLKDCGRGRCVKDSQNPGTNSEQITAYLEAGTYYLVVDGYNGAAGSYTLSLDCPAECYCELDLDVSTTNTACGQNRGEMVITSTGGTPAYVVSWEGPVSGSFVTFENTCTLTGFPAGTYVITKTDGAGCSASETVVISDGFSFTATAVPTACGPTGAINISVDNGTPGYHVEISGPENRDFITGNSNINVNNLLPGTYQIYITDINGCCTYQLVTIEEGNSNFNFAANANGATCDEFGSISVNVFNGSPTYTVIVSGPTSGTAIAQTSNFTIRNLPGGTYWIEIIDSNDCSEGKEITVETTDLSVQTTVQNGICNQSSAISLYVSGGSPSYTISWTGPSSGSQTTFNNTSRITNLANGSYNITVRDANNCSEYKVVTVQNSNMGVDFNTTAVSNTCGAAGSIWLDIATGDAPYTINWDGPTPGTGTTETNGYSIPELFGGNYIITLTDDNGCSSVDVIYVNTGTGLTVEASTESSGCGGAGAVNLMMSGAPGPYDIIWTGTTNGNINTEDANYALDLPSGTYAVNVFSSNGCGNVQNVTINSTGNVQTSYNIQPGACGQPGSVVVTIQNSTGPYEITWQGPVEGSSVYNTSSYMIASLPTGTYQISLTTGDGCSTIETINVDNGSNPISMTTNSNSSNCAQTGSINVQINGSNPPYEIIWEGRNSGSATANSNTYLIPDLLAGNYIIVVKDQNDCTVEQVTSVTDEGGISIQSTSNIGNCGEGASIDLNIIGGRGTFSISWSGPTNGATTTNNTSYTIQELISGEYVISITDANNCASTTTVTTEMNSTIDLDSTPSDVSCHGTNDGSIVVSGRGGNPPYTYQWSNGATGDEIHQLEAANYIVTATDSEGCFIIKTITVEEPHELYATTTSTEPSCNNNNGSATAQAGGGVPPYSYQWSNGGTQATITGLASGTYFVTVTDANTCTIVNSQTIGTSGQLPTVNFSYTQDALTFNLNNQSSEGTYLWDFGDGNTSTQANPSHVFCEESTYQICLTTTNSCGSETHCDYVQTAIPSHYVVISLGSVVAAPNATVAVPVMARNINNLVSIAGSLQIDNASVGTIEGVQEGKIVPQFNVNNQTFSYYEAGGEGVVIEENDVLFYVLVNLTGGAGSSTKVLINNSPLVVEVGGMVNGTPTVLDHLTLKGEVTIDENAQVGGWVQTYWGEGISDVDVEVVCTNFTEIFTTDETGIYQVQNIPYGDEATINASKNTNPDNGLSTFSLFLGQRFILGMSVDAINSPYQIIAGDANCSNSFTTLDLFIIQQMIIGTRTEFPDCPSWVFVTENSPMPSDFDAYNVFPYESISSLTMTKDTTANFIGVKVGDLLGQANPQNLADNYVDTRSQMNELNFIAHNKAIKEGETFDITFKSNNFNDIVSIQMGMNWDGSQVSYVSFAPNEMSGTVASTPEDTDQTIRMSWFDTQGVGADFEEDDNLFTISFIALTDITNFENILEVDTVSFQTEAHNSQLEPMDIVLIFENEDMSTNLQPVQKTAYQLHQNVPNPFTTTTQITFDLPTAMDAELVIYNTIGEVVKTYDDHYKKGQNHITFQKDGIGNGVYYYTLKTKDFSQTRKMTIVQ